MIFAISDRPKNNTLKNKSGYHLSIGCIINGEEKNVNCVFNSALEAEKTLSNLNYNYFNIFHVASYHI